MFSRKPFWIGIGLVAMILFLAATALLAFAAPAGQSDQPIFPSAKFLGEGGSYTIVPGDNLIVKVKPFGFNLVPGPSYEAKPEERVWSTNADEAPEAFYGKWAEYGQVASGCVVRYLAIDDDPEDGRRNAFQIGEEVVHELPEGMSVTGSFVVKATGDLKLYAHDSVGLIVSPCGEIVTPTPTPSPTATSTSTPSPSPSPTATSTPTPTATPFSQNGLVYLPLIVWGEQPPPPTPTPTATPAPAEWHMVHTWGDPHYTWDVFPSETTPYQTERPETSLNSYWPNGRQVALAAYGHLVEFQLEEVVVNGEKLQKISAVFVDDQLVEIEPNEMVEIPLGNIHLFVELSCGEARCHDVWTWWRQTSQAQGLLVDVFNVLRAKAATQ